MATIDVSFTVVYLERSESMVLIGAGVAVKTTFVQGVDDPDEGATQAAVPPDTVKTWPAVPIPNVAIVVPLPNSKSPFDPPVLLIVPAIVNALNVVLDMFLYKTSFDFLGNIEACHNHFENITRAVDF